MGLNQVTGESFFEIQVLFEVITNNIPFLFFPSFYVHIPTP